MCSPFGPRPGLLVLTGMNGGVFASSTTRSLPWATAQIRLSRLAVITSSTSISRWATTRLVWPSVKLQVGAAAEDRVAVDGAIAIEPVEVLVEDRLAELVEARSLLTTAVAGEQSRSMITSASCRLPCSFRWTPLIVSGSAAFS